MEESLDLYLYNTVTKRKDQFVPLDFGNVRMYVCGPTVYDRPHIGNIRSAVVYDVLYRVLQILFPRVTYVRNITDVDDKIIHACAESGENMQELTQRMTKAYEDDVASVLCLSPTFSPKATQHIHDMISMIQRLIESEYAYVAEKHVLFDITRYHSYGSLSRRNLDEMIAGSRIEIAPFKKHPADFVLWKPSKTGEEDYAFESPWGLGRPGWHIECSAMSTKYLGSNFDIHGGGVDLVFPHHENEVAQSVCANKGSNFAKVWIHNGFLTVNGEKMSKSLNNFTLLKDLLAKGLPGIVMRYFYLMTHYRKPIDFNDMAITSAAKSLNKLATAIEPFIAEYNNDLNECDRVVTENLKIKNIFEFIEILCNDLNTPAFLSKLLQCGSPQKIATACALIGFVPSALHHYKNSEIDPTVVELANQREKAKSERNWMMADALRNEIITRGYNVMDQKSGGFKLMRSI